MKRAFLTFVLGGLMGSFLLAGDAQACHKKKCTCAPTCVTVMPAPAPAPVCEPTCAPKKKCGMFSCFKGMKLCHKKATCVTSAPCETVAYSAPMTYAAPAVYSSPQASAQH